MNRTRIFSALCAIVLLLCAASAAAAPPALSAASAVLMEAESGQILAQTDAHRRMPMASTTKIMTALAALEHGDIEDIIRVPPEAVGVEGSSVSLKEGESLTLGELLYALLLESANDAAAAIAVALAGDIPRFADWMNETAARLGMNDTHFTNPHGLDESEHYTTAYDLALLTRYALQNETFAEIVSTKKTSIPWQDGAGTRVLVNHNRLLRVYDGAVGVKTGYTSKSGRCLVSAAERGGVRLIAVTLSAPDDWNDHVALLDYGFSLCTSVLLARDGEISVRLPCLGSPVTEVTASNTGEVRAVLPRTHGPVTVSVETNHVLAAPVAAGDTVGRILFSCDGRQIASVPLVARTAADAVPQRLSFFGRLMNSIRGE